MLWSWWASCSLFLPSFSSPSSLPLFVSCVLTVVSILGNETSRFQLHTVGWKNPICRCTIWSLYARPKSIILEATLGRTKLYRHMSSSWSWWQSPRVGTGLPLKNIQQWLQVLLRALLLTWRLVIWLKDLNTVSILYNLHICFGDTHTSVEVNIRITTFY